MLRTRYECVFWAYLSFIGAFLLFVGIDAMQQHDRWAMGDWLVNYTGGFVRRGLVGQVALGLSQLPPHISLYHWIFSLQLLCYATVFGTLVYLVRNLAWTFWMVLMVYSPATLSFTFFDPTFAFRKEILFLALLGAVILASKTKIVSDIGLSLLLTIAMVVLVLSHEGMVFYYPYVICAAILSRKHLRRAILITLPGAVSGICSFVAASRHPGTLSTVSAICSSLGEHDLAAEPCSGAIVYMTKTPAAAHQDVLTAISYWHLKFIMPFLLIMSLSPVIMGLSALCKVKKARFGWRVLVTCAGIAWLSSIALFVYGFDWNRWIYIHVFSTLMLMLLLERDQQMSVSVVQQPLFKYAGRYRYGAIATAALFTCAWQLSFYHHFPLPGDKLAGYLANRLHHRPAHKRLDWNPAKST